FTGDSVSVNPNGTTNAVCGDWVIIGGLTLTGTARGPVHAGGNVSWLARTAADSSTLWASTSAGRVLISNNANAADPNAVTFTQIDNLAPNSPGRAISNVFIDPANANHAWISYLGYNATTPSTPGHLFSVVYNPATSVATWTPIDGTGAGFIGDQPVNSVVEDKQTGDLYASTDFGVMRMAADDTA